MQKFKITISFSKSGDYFDYDVRSFAVTSNSISFTDIDNKYYVFDFDVIYEVTIGLVK